MNDRKEMEDMHAYLIMAHSNYNQLLQLLKSLDDKRNYIFVHLDSKFVLNEEQIEKNWGQLPLREKKYE